MDSIKRRHQRDYTLVFKLAAVDQVEKGELSYKKDAQTRYGILSRSTVVWLRKHASAELESRRIHSSSQDPCHERASYAADT
jgi:hypothetical protein